MFKFLTKFLDFNQKEVDRLQKTVDEINSFERKIKKLKTEDFVKKTAEFKKRIKDEASLREVLPEAFALAREASDRALGIRPFDVQMMASVALFEGKVAEQKTGEGKTLSAVPALYLRALMGKGAHLVTVNDYLARRDAGWNGPVFEMLGLTVGSIVQEMKSYVYDKSYSDTAHGDERLEHLKPVERREAYKCDVTYGTNNEFGFDYLRDNMVQNLEEISQKYHYFAIVDEVDSILIDEARTPLIISAPDMEPTQKYYEHAKLIEKLNPDTDFKIDEKAKTATLTEHGILRVEKLLGVDNLYEKDFKTIHHIESALRAKTLFLRDRDYIVKDNAVTIVDEFTGRLMFGRRWSDGLHQAVEAKEGVVIQQESKTLATISFQNYFRMYEHLSGMTGTAVTEAEEFHKIYKLDVVSIPTNNPMVRLDKADIIYKNLRSKYGAIVNEIEDLHKKGQPVLVGTTSIEKNEIVSDLLKRKRIPHLTLNAKNHEKEASTIADAGKKGAVTVATNMAGRGVDIELGGTKPRRKVGQKREVYEGSVEYKKWKQDHDAVVASGGLVVIGTERHESRRIDNQLRGRAGRQGDNGASRFYLSLEDDLMRIFGGEQIKGLMDRLNIPEDQPIENKLISRAIESAQIKVEGFNFDMRKSVVEYDDVNNQQREIIYKLRKELLEAKDVKEKVLEKLEGQISGMIQIATSVVDNLVDVNVLVGALMEVVPFDDISRKQIEMALERVKGDRNKLEELLVKVIKDTHATREKQVGEKVMREIEKFAYISSIDHLWMDHIDAIDDLREGVRLRAYGQRDPLVEFKSEAFDMFESLLVKVDEELCRRIYRIGVQSQNPEVPLNIIQENRDVVDAMGLSASGSHPEAVKSGAKLGRNDPCWCNSGKKWKHCHYPQYG